MILAIIIGISILAIFLHYFLGWLGGKGTVDISIKNQIEKVIHENGWNTIVKEGPNVRPCYNYEVDQVEIREGKTTKHLAEAFHELGHAVDAHRKNLLDKDYGVWSGLLFYVMKYSLPLAIFLHSVVAGVQLDYIALSVLTYIFIALSVVFTTITLLEELRATRYGKMELRNNILLSKENWSKVNITLWGGLTSYIVLFLLAYITLGFQLYYEFVGKYM